MDITREEIFGPMLSIVARDIEEELIVTANATVYAISGSDSYRILHGVPNTPIWNTRAFAKYHELASGLSHGRLSLWSKSHQYPSLI